MVNQDGNTVTYLNVLIKVCGNTLTYLNVLIMIKVCGNTVTFFNVLIEGYENASQ